MIKSVTAYTYEIDDPAAAVEEILSQLKPLKLTKDMIGIVTCSYDYIELGVIKALSEALPFDLVGETTISQAVYKEAGLLVLTLMVLYSDDCRFAGGVTDVIPASGDITAAVEKSYREAGNRLGEKEKLVIAFPPLLNGQPGDNYVNVLSALSSRTPIFGSICADDKPDTYENAHTIYNAEAYRDRMTFILISGNFSPEFRIVSISGESRLPYKGEITESKGNILMGINDMPVVSYLETIGLATEGKIRSGINSIPFLINFKNDAGTDDVSVARALFMTTPENYAVCGGEMPVGSSITVGVCDKNDVVETTGETIREINSAYKNRSVLMFSCLGRRFALGTEPLLEVQIAADEMSEEINFMLSYSSGEICPTSVHENLPTNRFHNYTFIACIF